MFEYILSEIINNYRLQSQTTGKKLEYRKFRLLNSNISSPLQWKHWHWNTASPPAQYWWADRRTGTVTADCQCPWAAAPPQSLTGSGSGRHLLSQYVQANLRRDEVRSIINDGGAKHHDGRGSRQFDVGIRINHWQCKFQVFSVFLKTIWSWKKLLPPYFSGNLALFALKSYCLG